MFHRPAASAHPRPGTRVRNAALLVAIVVGSHVDAVSLTWPSSFNATYSYSGTVWTTSSTDFTIALPQLAPGQAASIGSMALTVQCSNCDRFVIPGGPMMTISSSQSDSCNAIGGQDNNNAHSCNPSLPFSTTGGASYTFTVTNNNVIDSFDFSLSMTQTCTDGSTMTIGCITPTPSTTPTATRSSSSSSTQTSSTSSTSSSTRTSSRSSSSTSTSTRTSSGSSSSSSTATSSGSSTSSSTRSSTSSSSSSSSSSASGSSSGTMSSTMTATATSSSSLSGSSTATATCTGTSTSTAGSTTSKTGTCTSALPDSTSSSTSSRSPTVTTSITASLSASGSASRQPIVMGSGLTITLQVMTVLGGTAAQAMTGPSLGSIMLRDVDAALHLTVSVTGCTAPLGCSLVCSSSSDDVRIAMSASSIVDGSVVQVLLWAQYRVGRRLGSLSCTATRIRDGITSSTQVAATVTHTALPLVSDIWTYSTPTNAGLTATNLWSSTPCLLPLSVSSLSFDAASSAAPALDEALYSSCVTYGSALSPVYTLLCNGGANMTFVAPSGGFNSSTRVTVTVAGVPVAASRPSLDGTLMHIRLPSSYAVCAAADCGYVPLTIQVDDTLSLPCPGMCTDAIGYTPICNAGVCAAAAIGDGSSPPIVMDPGGSVASGLYLTSACVSSIFVPPSPAVCLNISHPSFNRCAFGAGDSCSPCPRHAMCPGGFRAWYVDPSPHCDQCYGDPLCRPLPGYFTPVESSGIISACPQPSTRCSGWNASASLVICAPGYRPRSYQCTACDVGYYISNDATCSRCALRPSVAASIIPFLTFTAYLMVALAAIYGAMLGMAATVKSRRDDIHNRMLALAAWSFAVIQLVAQAGQHCAAGLPDILTAMYAALAVAQFSSVTVPSACIDGYPFVSEVTAMSIGIAVFLSAVGVAVVASMRRPSAVSLVQSWTLRMLAVTMTLLYPATINSSLSLVVCTSVRMSVTAYLSLDGDGTTLGRAGYASTGTSAAFTSINVLVQASNPSHVCYEASHTSAAALAWVALLLVGGTYPLLCVLLVRNRLRYDARLSAAAAQLRLDLNKLTTRLQRGASVAQALRPEQHQQTVIPAELPSQTPHDCHSALNPLQLQVEVQVGGLHDGAVSTFPHISGSAPAADSLRATDIKADVSLKSGTTRVGSMLTSAHRTTVSRSALLVHSIAVYNPDLDPRVLIDPLLIPFIRGDYRPSYAYFYSVDRVMILTVAIANATLRSTTDIGSIVARTTLITSALTLNFILLQRLQPFHEHEWWRRGVKCFTLLLACVITILNGMASGIMMALADGSGLSGVDGLTILFGSYVTFALCVALLAALPLAFMLNAIHPPPRHVDAATVQRDIEDGLTSASVTPAVGMMRQATGESASGRSHSPETRSSQSTGSRSGAGVSKLMATQVQQARLRPSVSLSIDSNPASSRASMLRTLPHGALRPIQAVAPAAGQAGRQARRVSRQSAAGMVSDHDAVAVERTVVANNAIRRQSVMRPSMGGRSTVRPLPRRDERSGQAATNGGADVDACD